MWFKQVQLFQLNTSINTVFLKQLQDKLEPLSFTPCLPSMHQSMGFVSPIGSDENPSLVRVINQDYAMICLQIEEKVLPSAVIRQALDEAVKEIETSENRKLKSNEKLRLKDEITMTLLPRAFSKKMRIYAYFDCKNHWLVVGTGNAKKTEDLIAMLKKSVTDDIHPMNIKELSATMTSWLKHQNYSSSFSIEKACVLQDPKQANRTIRCKQQDLFYSGIQSLIKDGCAVIQLALSWQDRVSFILSHQFLFSSLQFSDEILDQVKEMEAESKQQQFDADFYIMTEVLSKLLIELIASLNTAAVKPMISLVNTA